VANGAGNFSIWLHRFWRYTSFGSQLGPRGGAMGYGLPAAVAAKLACPDRPVVAVTGDGDFLMTGQELATAVRHALPVLVVLVNNGLYGTIRMHQERAHPGRMVGTDLVNPDFAALARAYGAHGEVVERTGEFPAALDRALASAGPALLELRTDPGVLRPPG
jgi:acetolactate synthase I/II/III large subunit